MRKLGLLSIIPAGLWAQQAATQPSVSGVVVNAVTGEGVRKAEVILTAKDQEKDVSYDAESDGNGRFHFDKVQPGEYFFQADRDGFVAEFDGSPGAPPPPVKVEAGQSLRDVKIRMNPLGVITGRVLDEDGDPMRRAVVYVMEYSYFGGKKQLRGVRQVQTNDKGEFRLFELTPGTKFLRASARYVRTVSLATDGIAADERTAGYADTFFPSSTDVVHATPIELAAGAHLNGYDIRLRREARYSIRGKLPAQMRTGNTDEGQQNYTLQIIPRGPIPEISANLEMDNETFVFKDVPPGSYFIVCTSTDVEHGLRVRQPVEIKNADLEGVTLNMAAPVEVSGVVRIEGTPSRPLENLNVRLQAEESDYRESTGTRVKPDGSFVFEHVTPGVYEVVVGPHPGAYQKSVRFGDEDAPDGRIDLTTEARPLVIVLGTDVGEVEGSVKNANGGPASRVRVTLIAYGNHLGRGDLSRSGFTDEQGKFHLKNVAPGEYKVFAWENVPVGAPQDPEFRKPFEKQSVPVMVASSGHETVELTAISIKAARRAAQ